MNMNKDQIVKLIKREIKSHKGLARGIRKSITNMRPSSDIIEQAEALRDTLVALSTLEGLLMTIREAK